MAPPDWLGVRSVTYVRMPSECGRVGLGDCSAEYDAEKGEVRKSDSGCCARVLRACAWASVYAVVALLALRGLLLDTQPCQCPSHGVKAHATGPWT